MESEEDQSDRRDSGNTLNAMVRVYATPLSAFFSRRLSSPADVPDLVQDVFLRLSRLPDAGSIRRPESFVFVTAANVLRDRLRRGKVRGEGLAEPIEENILAGSDFAPDRVLEGKEAVACMRNALAELPERTRDVFVMRVLEGWKMAEIARVLGVSTRAVEKHQARALAHVAARLEGWR